MKVIVTSGAKARTIAEGKPHVYDTTAAAGTPGITRTVRVAVGNEGCEVILTPEEAKVVHTQLGTFLDHIASQ